MWWLLSNSGEKYCEENRIHHSRTFPRSLQQNGAAERRNPTILNMSHSLLKRKWVPEEFRTEAVDCAIYLLNQCRTSSVCNKTTQKACNGRKPSVPYLKVFCVIAYAHISEQVWSKFDDRSAKHMCIGYDSSFEGYKLYNPTSVKTIG